MNDSPTQLDILSANNNHCFLQKSRHFILFNTRDWKTLIIYTSSLAVNQQRNSFLACL